MLKDIRNSGSEVISSFNEIAFTFSLSFFILPVYIGLKAVR